MNLERARQLQTESLDLMASKNADYGSQNIEITGTQGVSVRLLDKTMRLINLTKSGKEPNHESVRDTFRDVMNYGLIGLMLEEGSWDSKPTNHGSVQTVNEEAPEFSEEIVGVNSDLISRLESGGVRHWFPCISAFEDEQRRWRDESTEAPLIHHKPGGMVYLGGPIDMASSDEQRVWRKEATAELARLDVGVFDPSVAFGGNGLARRAVMDICKAAIDECAVMLVCLPAGVPAFGTIREIEYARASNTPVIIVSNWVDRALFSSDCYVYSNGDPAQLLRFGIGHAAKLVHQLTDYRGNERRGTSKRA